MYLTYNVKEYFDCIVDFEQKSVLDFGCNHANFLLGNQNFSSYTGVDIDKDIIDAAIQQFPQHTWHLYNNYNWQYNVDIEIDTQWPALNTYDVGLAYSVFTHTDFDEFKATVDKLKKHCAVTLATFLSTNSKENIKQVLSHRKEYFENYIDQLTDLIHNKDTVTILVSKHKKQIHVLQDIHSIPKATNTEYMLTFYSDSWLQNNIGGEIVDVTHKFDGILGTQKCLKLYTAL